MNKVHHRACKKCGTKYELMEHRRWNGDGYDEPTLHPLHPRAPEGFTGCPRCRSQRFELAIATPALVSSKTDDHLSYALRAPNVSESALSDSHFPYFDAGLGTMVHSIEHREHLKTHYKDGTRREPGEELVCVEDAMPWMPEDILSRELAHTQEVNRRYNEYKSEMLAHPDTRKAWHDIEAMVAARDLSALGVDDPEFFGPTHYPAQGEAIKQDLDGHLYQDSGWASDHPQPWVPQALEAAGHKPMLPTDPGPAGLLEG